MVKRWVVEFKMAWTSTNDDPSDGHPIEAITPAKVLKIHKIIFADCRMKVSGLAETLGISTECVCNILHEYLCMTKLYVRWVPCLLTLDQNQC